ncbi:hypothetical protein NCAS_0I00690 [Naumovozyma castellii]|uniref:Uncharacterized protein n=1 Tax=Naumovozyma castellii TaxID=27288 RepID=G0VJQ6_NAUCA|nr:hypothetical protein NCAS_0I00690 [Naumovozyma castellii CBS 4309]CCC71737.1 hypothetical protein NCAS_0I00690 [Naumovozyma castellii CBS 4309]
MSLPNLGDYMSLATTPGTGFTLDDMPAGVLSIGMALAGATDHSYTSMYSEVDMAGVSSMLTQLPWYSSRLKAQIDSIVGAPATSAAASSAAPATSAAATSSVEAASSSFVEASSSASSSAAASSSSSAKATTVSTKAAASSSAVAAISQIDDGQIQATVSQQTENGAAKAVVGMGAFAAAAALLL